MNKENYFSCYGESDERCIREESRKEEWLSRKTKFFKLSYSKNATDSFITEPRFGTVDYALKLSDDKEHQKEILEVGLLKSKLNFERESDSIIRRVRMISDFMSNLTQGIHPDAVLEKESTSILFNFKEELGVGRKEDISYSSGVEFPDDLDFSTSHLMSDLRSLDISYLEYVSWKEALRDWTNNLEEMSEEVA